jgi:hypothetical protein
MSRISTSSSIALTTVLIAALSGCAYESSVPPGSSVRNRLAQPTVFTIGADEGNIRVTSQLGDDGVPTLSEIEVVDGAVSVSTAPDGSLRLDAVDLSIADLVVGAPGGPIEGLVLTNLQGSLEAPVTLISDTTETDQQLNTIARIDLTLDWAIREDNGNVLSLASLQITNIELDAYIGLDENENLELQISAERSGAFWEYSRRIELSDLSIETSALGL